MALTLRTGARLFARVAAPLLFASSLSACSSIPDWVDPTTWVGENHTLDQSNDAGPDGTQSADAGTASGTSQSTNAGQTPDIAAIPAKPAPPSTAEEQSQVADSLTADRAQAQYSADTLRGGTEAAAPPPSAAPPPDAGDAAMSSTAALPKQDQAAASEPSSPASQPDQSGAAGSAPPPPDAATAAPNPDTGAEGAAAPGSAPQAPEPSAAPAAPSGQMASADTESASAPAAAPLSPDTAAPANPSASDMQANFAPSRAPALDPSVSQFVPPQILSRYQQTAAAAAAPGLSNEAAVPHVKHRHHKKMKTSRADWRHDHLALASRRTEISLPS